MVIRFWSIETKCDYHIHIKCIAQYDRIDFICSLYDCELLYFSERLKKKSIGGSLYCITCITLVLFVLIT